MQAVRLVRRRVVFLSIFLVAAWAVSSVRPLFADSFNWASLGGANWMTPVKDQFDGTCWAFAAVGIFESHYKLTRNDPSYNPDMSEQQLVWETNPDLGSTNGGDPIASLNYMSTNGIVAETTCPYQPSSPDVGISPYWPLTAGSATMCWKGTGTTTQLTATTDNIKTMLKLYGPLETAVLASNDIFPSVATLAAAINSGTTSTSTYTNHAVVVTGYVDDDSLKCKGYWIIKNSWGSGSGTGGYYYAPYGYIENHNNTWALTGAVYYTGALGTATWSGGSGTWASGSSNKWSTVGNITAAWQNRETMAVFNATGSTVTLSGAVIAHGLNIGGSGYFFNGGSLTVTGGGINTTQNVTLNQPITVGAPQTWTIAAGKAMTVTGAVHTVVSDLTLANSGTLSIGGPVDGGGVINAYGAPPGSIIQTGSGITYLNGATDAATNLTVSAGTVIFAGTTMQLGGYAVVGDSGTATFTQSGGSTTIASYLSLGSSSSGNATYNLNGGLLTVGGIPKGSGTALLNFGAATLQATASFSSSVAINLTATGGNATIDTQDYAIVLSGVVNGTGGLIKTGSGTLSLSGANSYGGGTLLSAGCLAYGAGSSLGTGTLTLSGGTLTATGNNLVLPNTLLVDSGESNYLTSSGSAVTDMHLGGSLTGGGSLTISASANYVWLRANDAAFSGTFIDQAVGNSLIFLFAYDGSGSASWVLNANARTYLLVGTVSFGALSGTNSSCYLGTQGSGNTVTYAVGALGASTTYAGHIYDGTSGTASGAKVGLVKLGTGTLTLTGGNVYTGGTTIDAGVLAYGANNAVGNGALSVCGGTLNLGSYNGTVGAVTLAGGAIAGTGRLTSTAGFTVSSGSVSAVLAGPVGLVKSTTDTVTLSGANVYTGTSSVNAGVLVVKGADAMAAVLAPAAATNIAAGKLVFDYTGTGAGDSISSQVNSILAASYHGGSNSWASGVLYSTLANANSAAGYALGWTNNTTTSAVVVQVALYGDANLDGTVNIDDLNKVLGNYDKPGTWADGDFNYDGTVNISDLSKVLGNYDRGLDLAGMTVSTSQYTALDGQAIAALESAGATVVPEPGTLALLTAGLMGLFAYSWRRRR